MQRGGGHGNRVEDPWQAAERTVYNAKGSGTQRRDRHFAQVSES